MAAVLLLSGCSLIRGPEPQPVSCPTTGMLREGASLTRYKPNSVHDLTNVQLSANIVDVSANCVFVPEPRQVDMALGLRIIAERGAAAPAGEQQFAYIVAVTTPDQRFLSRQVYRLAATFPGNARRAGFEEVLNLNFPLKEGQTAADFRVYVSLQLQPDELNDNLQAR
tara:strand:- start:166 stop:669 length:504 start_codon:yes stop_codon:yes gene_type:complete